MSNLQPELTRHTVVTVRRCLLLLLLMGLYLMVRLDGWLALPIFGDEAIYLRWSELVKDNFGQHGWISLIDPKPPLHYWLMAGAWGLLARNGAWADPLRAGRMVSIGVAVVMIPALTALCAGLQGLYRREGAREQMSRREALAAPLAAPPGAIVGLLGCLLFIVCPFLAFYQRLALADGIFAVESIAAGWLAVRLALAARATDRPTSVARGLVTQALPLGVMMGATMLTRQIVSYELWVLPVAGFVLTRPPKNLPCRTADSAARAEHSALRRFLMWLGGAFFVASLLWSPFLVAQPGRYRSAEGSGPVTGQSLATELRRRVLYQPQFTEKLSVHDRLIRIEKNFLTVFVPGTWSADGHFSLEPWAQKTTGRLDTGWYWIYLTPPIFLLGLLGWIWLALRRQWGLLMFLALWLLLMVGPLIFVGSVAYSRYTLAGAVPWLIVVAYLLADVIAWLFSERGLAAVGWVASAATAILLAAVLAWPAYDINLQNHRWQNQPVVRRDKYQYITGWTAGGASTEAIAYLKSLPPGPLVIITGDGWGTPSDAVWVYLQDRPQTSLYYVEGNKENALEATGANSAEGLWRDLHEHKWLYEPAVTVGIDRHVPVLYVSPDPVHTPTADVPAQTMMQRLNPQAQKLLDFHNPGEGESVVIFRLQ